MFSKSCQHFPVCIVKLDQLLFSNPPVGFHIFADDNLSDWITLYYQLNFSCFSSIWLNFLFPKRPFLTTIIVCYLTYFKTHAILWAFVQRYSNIGWNLKSCKYSFDTSFIHNLLIGQVICFSWACMSSSCT